MSAVMDHRRATVRDVAALAGVSIKTVSRVVNDEPNVARDTRERVRRAIATLHYVPDASAASLARSGRPTRSIALLIASVDNPFCSAVFRGVEEVARDRQVAVLAASTEGQPEIEETLIRAFMSRSVDGFVIMPTNFDHRQVAALLGSRLPAVYIDRAPAGIATDVIASNNRESAVLATRHLLQRGHRRIGLLADSEAIQTAVERRAGYETALRDAGVAVDDDLIEMNIGTVEDAIAAARRLFGRPQPPTAVFASRNSASIGAMAVLKELGLSHRVALIGMDDIEMSEIVDPPLTVLSQDAVGMGHLAARRLLQRIDGADIPPETLIIPATLIERGSGEIACSSEVMPA